MHRPLSYSGIGTYEKCPKKFYYKYIEKVETEPLTEETAPAMFRGTRMHAELEDYLNDLQQHLGPETISQMGFASMLKKRGAQPEVEFCFDNNWESQPFDSEEGLIRGVIDVQCIDDEDPHAFVYDWKTGKIYDDHAHQRQLYALAILIQYPHVETVTSGSVYIDQNKTEIKDFNRASLTAYKWIWEKKVNKCRPPQDYPARKSWLCKFCEFGKTKGGPCANG